MTLCTRKVFTPHTMVQSLNSPEERAEAIWPDAIVGNSVWGEALVVVLVADGVKQSVEENVEE